MPIAIALTSEHKRHTTATRPTDPLYNIMRVVGLRSAITLIRRCRPVGWLVVSFEYSVFPELTTERQSFLYSGSVGRVLLHNVSLNSYHMTPQLPPVFGELLLHTLVNTLHALQHPLLGPARDCSPRHVTPFSLNSVSGLALKIWYRVPFDQSEQSKAEITLTDSPKVRPGRNP